MKRGIFPASNIPDSLIIGEESMMEGLQEIRDAVQGIAEAITAALNIDTEIVDDTLIKLALNRLLNRL